MFLSATNEIRVETAGSDVSYILPPRPLGNLRWFGLVPVAFSFIFISFPFKSVAQSIGRIIGGNNDSGNWVFMLFLIPFVVAGLLPMWLGLLMIAGRCRVDWRNQKLSVLDYAGPIRWRRRMPAIPVRRFTVAFGGAKVNDQPVTIGPPASLGALSVEFENGKLRMLILGYPRDWLQELAEDLSTHVGAIASGLASPKVEVIQAPLNGAKEMLPQDGPKPPNTRIKINAKFNGVSIDIPPAGLRAGKGLFTVGVVWCLFLSLIGAGFFFAKGKAHEVTPYLFIAGFWLIGLALMAGALNMIRRRATLTLEGGRLVATQTSLFGKKHHEWGSGEIAAVRAGPSGMEVNGKPVIELQIHPANGKKVGLLAGRDEQELRWIATELRKTLNVPATS